jgi:Domain of unknown function DUF29
MSRLVVLVRHLLKWSVQPMGRYLRTGGSIWLSTIIEQRRQLADIFEHSPSLKSHGEQMLKDAYRYAVKEASAETGIPLAQASAETGIPIQQFPEQCPFGFEQVLEDEFLPE